MDKISDYLKYQREARNVSLEDLSKATLISVATLKDIESGKFDKYRGDETYVRMYLKKIAKFLELDTSEISDLLTSYEALTQEIELKEVEAEQERLRQAEEIRKQNKNKIGESIKEAKAGKGLAKRRKKIVYEDNYIARYVKYGVILVLVVAIVFVIWYSLSSSQPDEGNTVPQNDTTTNDNPNANTETQQPTPTEPEVPEEPEETVTITNTSQSSFDVAGLKEGDPIIFEVTFKVDSTFNLWIDGSDVPNVLRTYTANETYKYEDTFTVGKNYLFNIWTPENVEIKINGQTVEYQADRIQYLDGVSYFYFNMRGE